MGTGLEHYEHVSPQHHNSKNSLAYGLKFRMFNCSLMCKTQLLGNGQLMVPTPPARLKGFSFRAHIGSSNMTSFGRRHQRISDTRLDPHAR